jgi:hypothetical protein
VSIKSKTFSQVPVLTPVILATQRQRSGGSWFEASLGKQFTDPISKNPSPKRGGGIAQGVIPEFKPQFLKKKKKV